MNAKKLNFCPYKIHWYEGMPLSPHHFQQSDITNEKLVSYILSKTMPHHWGIIDIDLDTINLKEGIIHLNSIEAILEDKSIIIFPLQKDEPMSIKFKENIQKNKPLKIFLVKPNSYHTYESESHDQSYQSIQIDSTEDYNNGENSTCVFKLKPIYKIAFDEVPLNYTGIQLCTIVDTNAGFQIGTYDAPCIDVNLAKNIIKETKRLIKLLKDKTIHIKNQININNNKYNPATINSIFMQGILPVEHIIHSRNSHPQSLFSALVNLIAHISVFNLESIFQDIPIYHHANLFKSFQPIFTFIQNILDEIKEPYLLHDFEQKESVYFMNVDEKLTSDEIFLLISYDNNVETSEMNKWNRDCIIASESMLNTAIETRVLGVQRETIDMHSKSDKQIIIKIESSDRFFKAAEKLCIYNPSLSHSPISISLIEFINE
ncbi:type VI secretion system baseplate subunit TssK [Candidatus Cytomitobacter primus]|uniref:Type VI secretion system baseplate subunit TssK n=1 Tax=Candidatus Cytomitobacter primus TaxID=2066024 RepID=A0A5C0UGE9_9PROT|nr:type VI secretion system baseplate subunit TssK [Candidatus Cytomitobacter primus]QEK38362.1 hypothetical protein FZC34_00275 [Candidatus Cytomitobacter primus]